MEFRTEYLEELDEEELLSHYTWEDYANEMNEIYGYENEVE